MFKWQNLLFKNKESDYVWPNMTSLSLSAKMYII